MNITLRKPVPTATGGAFHPSEPRVNLLPPEAQARSRSRRDRSLAVGAVALAAVAIGAFGINGVLAKSGLNSDLAALEAEKNELSVELAVYAPVTNVAGQSNALMDTVKAQTANEVQQGEVFERFLKTIGDVGSVQRLTLTTSETSACVATDPFNEVPMVGCMTFTVDSASGASGAPILVERLQEDQWFTDAFIPNITDPTDGEVVLTGTVGITSSSVTTADDEAADDHPTDDEALDDSEAPEEETK